jgi:WD40 repeat protein
MRVLLLIFFALLSVPGVGAQDELPPYIHYFDHLRGGLVIERADGTDRRMIPDVPMDAGPPVWSPSGKWMVIGHEIISTDGTKTSPYPQRIYFEDDKQWAPDDDLLLIVGTDWREGAVISRIYDVENQTVVADVVVQYWGIDPPYWITLHWASDGQRAFIHWADHLITLDLDGRVAVRVNPQLSSVFGYRPLQFDSGRLLTQTFFIESARSAIVMQDMETGALVELEDEAGWPSEPAIVRWSPTLDHALIYAADCSEESCESSLRLLEWDTGKLTTITPAIPIPDDDIYCADQPSCANIWSPSGRFASLIDENRNVYVLDVTTGTTETLPAKPSYFEWLSGDKLLWPYNGLYIYDPATGDRAEAIQLPDENAQHGYFPSPDGRYIALTTRRPTFIDRSGIVVAQTTPHSYSTQAVCCPYSYAWHSGSQWLMAEYIISFAGGGNGPISSLLFNIDNTIRRELPSDGHSGFLPDRAVPYLAPSQPVSFIKDPLFILPQDGRVDAVGWHPTDPNQLVTYSYKGGLTYWSLATGQPEIPQHIGGDLPYIDVLSDRPIHWLPDQDALAIYVRGELLRVDVQTGTLQPVDDVDYPVLAPSDNPTEVRYVESGNTLPLATDDQLGAGHILTSDMTGYVTFDTEQIDTGLQSLTYYVDAKSGRVAKLDIPTNFFARTADAKGGLAALGNIYDDHIVIVSTEDGHLIDRFYGTAVSLAISADGRRLATTSAGMTAIWDISEYITPE